MSSKALIPLIVGCAVGLFAIKLVVDVVQKAQGKQGGNLASVVVASREIAAYEAIQPEMLRTVQISKESMLEGAFAQPAEVEGRVPVVTVYKGMTLVENMLTPPGTIPGITAVIPEGYRAVSVKVDEETGGAGFIKPGHRVDVATVMNVKRGNRTETVSRVILQNVQVVAAGQQLTASEGAEATLSRSITLAVKAEDVSKLHLSATRGKIRLAIRNNTDAAARRLAGTTQRKVLGEDEGEPAEQKPTPSLFSFFGKSKAPEPAVAQSTPTLVGHPWSVVVVNGDQSETICFKDSRSMQRAGAAAIRSMTSRGVGWGGTATAEDEPVARPEPEPVEDTE